jgi:crotonobetainyl-CoA:carnitine CoA-transferase CaiB-like acyl-CoA transferase
VLANAMVEHGANGRRLGHAIKLNRTPMAVHREAPALGEHGREVLREAGYDDTAIDALIADRVVQVP